MTDRTITLEIPEELAHTAEQLGLLGRDHIINLLKVEIERHAISQNSGAGTFSSLNPDNQEDDGIQPSRRATEAAIRESMERVSSGKHPLRTLGRHAGSIWMSDDFDAPLPDEEWGDLFTKTLLT